MSNIQARRLLVTACSVGQASAGLVQTAADAVVVADTALAADTAVAADIEAASSSGTAAVGDHRTDTLVVCMQQLSK